MFASSILALCGHLSLLALEPVNSVEQSRQTLAKWVETRQLTSKAESSWQSDKETLQQTIQLFERELALVSEQTSKYSTNNTQVAKERSKAESLKVSSEAALNAVREVAAEMEKNIKALAA